MSSKTNEQWPSMLRHPAQFRDGIEGLMKKLKKAAFIPPDEENASSQEKTA